MTITALVAPLLVSVSLLQTPAQTPNSGGSAAASLPAAAVEAISKAATGAVALGEIARTCEAQLDRDRTAIRDIQKRTTDAANQKLIFEKALAEARAQMTAARSGSATNEARNAFNLANAQITEMNKLIQQLTTDVQKQNEDVKKQQDCGDKARKQLADLYNATLVPSRGAGAPSPPRPPEQE